MTDWERAICARVKTLRESIRWSQPPFAEQLGITRDQLAAIECGRTPLRYDIAWRLRMAFGISLLWLGCVDYWQGLPDNAELDNLPIPSATGLSQRALLSDVARRFHSSKRPALRAIGPEFEPRTEAGDELLRRGMFADSLKMRVDRWIAELPEGSVASFREGLYKAVQSFMAALPKESDSVIAHRMDQLMWHRIRMANARRTLVVKDSHRKLLTDVTATGKVSPVKSTMASLLDRLNKATSQRGMKSKLAKVIGVPLSNISQWLSGEREPGGETTLRLLQWVERQENKQECPGGAETPPERKTQPRKFSYEKPKSGPKKR
jgi:transcriptional regulator with XRE-family HTH domain